MMVHILNFSGAYPYDSWKKWVSLSSIISAETVSRLEPISGQIHSVTELLPNSVGDHIDEQETSIRCQNSEEREANLVCNQIMYFIRLPNVNNLLNNFCTSSCLISVFGCGV